MKGNSMKSEALAVQTVPAMTENRAQHRQVPGHLGFWYANYWRRMVSRSVVMLLFFLVFFSVLGAYAEQPQWSDLKGLKLGQGIEVVESNMKSHGGTFVAVTDDAITLRENDSDVAVKRESIARVSTTSGARRGEHAIAGLVAGGVIGAGIGAAAAGSGKNFIWSNRGLGALFGVLIGAPSGAAVGACIPAHTTIYRAPQVAILH
jgi:hypothetical protein